MACWRAGAVQRDRAEVGSKPGGLGRWVGRLVGRQASDVLEGGWNLCDPVVLAIGCR